MKLLEKIWPFRANFAAVEPPQELDDAFACTIVAQKKADTAATGKALATVKGVAYGGAPMRYQMWRFEYPIVLDLAGMHVSSRVPLLVDHENTTTGRLGLTAPMVRGGKNLYHSGEITASGERAENIVAQGAAGQPWQNSVGVDIIDAPVVEEGSQKINGRTVKAPFIWAKRSELREISIVSVGVDGSTEMDVQASRLDFSGDLAMELTNFFKMRASGSPAEPPVEPVAPPVQPVEPVAPPVQPAASAPVTLEPAAFSHESLRAAAEQAALEAFSREEARREAIRTTADYYRSVPEAVALRDAALSQRWDVAKFNAELLTKLRESRVTPNIAPRQALEGPERLSVLEASLALSSGYPGELALSRKEYSERTLDLAAKQNLGLRGLFIEFGLASGALQHYPHNFGREEITKILEHSRLQAAYSTHSISGILGNVASKMVMRGYETAPSYVARLCSPGDLNDYKEHEIYRLTNLGEMLPLGDGGEFKHGSLGQEKATNRLEQYGMILQIGEKTIVNDDMNMLQNMLPKMGVHVVEKEDDLFFARLLANAAGPTMAGDGVRLFHAVTHKNLINGAASAFSEAAMVSLLSLVYTQTNANGTNVIVPLKYLMVPVALRWEAAKLVKAEKMIIGGDVPASANNPVPDYNAMSREGLEVISPPQLCNSRYTAYSSVAWYLWGDPSRIETFQAGYLRGQRKPRTASGVADYTSLGVWFRIDHSFGVKEIDYRGVYKSAGA